MDTGQDGSDKKKKPSDQYAMKYVLPKHIWRTKHSTGRSTKQNKKLMQSWVKMINRWVEEQSSNHYLPTCTSEMKPSPFLTADESSLLAKKTKKNAQ